jgi:hypothetical protein
MSKVTQQAWKRRAPGGVPSQAEATDAETIEAASAGEPGGAESEVDLKATVTLSGEALAALLEEVKAAQRAAAGRGAEAAPTDELDRIDEVSDAASVAPAETSDWQTLPTPFRRGPQRSSGKT